MSDTDTAAPAGVPAKRGRPRAASQLPAVATAAPPTAVALSESAAILDVLSQAARDPNVDIEKFERLMAMQERIGDRRAAAAFAAALALMQPKLPVVARNGRITIMEKNDPSKVRQSTAYALWEDINEAIRPHLAEHGFALTFKTGTTPEGKVTVTGALCHAEGHREETTITLMQDSSGSKNAVQAIGSSISYGKRYTAGLLLNITSRGEDDDGTAAAAPEPISAEQAEELRALLTETDSDVVAFLTHAKAPTLEEVSAKEFGSLMTLLRRKRDRK